MILKDKVVVITGSSSGIGKATAELFAKEGAKLVLNSRNNEEGGNKLAAELNKTTEAIYEKADVGTREGARRLLDKAIEQFGQIDILINNAGTGKESDFLDESEEEMMTLIQDNIMSTLFCSQYAIKLMQKNDGIAKILNTSSIRGWEWGGNSPVYGATKAAVTSLTVSLARKYAPNILVNAVAPGFTETPNYQRFTPEVVRGYLDQAKLKRWIQAEEIADAFLFLAKNDAITGEVLYVDAGFRLK
jgi:3-oxoacyl-[acyl-carrier protein] reductase